MFRKPTKEALLLKDALEKLGIRVLIEVPDGHKHIDLGLPDARINVEVDGDHHSQLAQQMTNELINNSPEREVEALQYVAKSLQARINLWDSILVEIESEILAS